MSRSSRYLDSGRLEDVITLLHYLARTKAVWKYDKTIGDERELGTPASKPASKGEIVTWATVAKQHPEFFKVSPASAGPNAIQRLAEGVRPEVLEGGERNPLGAQITLWARWVDQPTAVSQERLDSLVRTAIQLHERQSVAAERRTAYLPLVAAFLGGLFTLAATLLPRLFGQ